MQYTVPSLPYDDEKEIVLIMVKFNNIVNYRDYAVGLTDVGEDYINWKYMPLYNFVVIFKTFPTLEIANRLKSKLVEQYKFQDLSFDSLHLNKNENSSNLFIVKHPQKVED